MPPAGVSCSGMDWAPFASCRPWGGCRKPVHPDHRRPRQAVADHAQGAKVVPPVGGSTLAPWTWPASPSGGSTADGMDRQPGYLLEGPVGTVIPHSRQPSERTSWNDQVASGSWRLVVDPVTSWRMETVPLTVAVSPCTALWVAYHSTIR